MSKRELLASDNLSVNDDEYQETTSIITSSETIKNMRSIVEQKKQELGVLVDIKHNETVENYLKKVSKLDEVLFDDDVLDRVKESIDSAYDYNMFAKARKEMHDLMMKQQLDSGMPNQKKGAKDLKIQLAYGNGIVALSVEE
ncbi:MAG: hypothetical protein GX811_06935 [Lentisphaerae bacterium]|nr:hypothetical protein [Lentisphaerota bacterium]